MNEVEMVRDLYDEPPAPMPQVIAEARVRMTESEEEAGRVRRGRGEGRRSARRTDRSAAARPAHPDTALDLWRRDDDLRVAMAETTQSGRRRWMTGGSRPARTVRRGLGILAVAAAVAAGVVIFDDGSPVNPGDRPQVGAGLPSARTVLLAAAARAEKEPVGRYWHAHVINGHAYHVAKGDYVITGAVHEIDQWLARGDRDADVFRSRFAGAHPQTPADVAAWKRAGSPKRWTVLSNKSRIPQSATSGPWDLRRITGAERQRCRPLCGTDSRSMSEREQERLLADPAELRRRVLSFKGQTSLVLPGRNEALTNATAWLTQPLSPRLRAASFRAIADLPGLRTVDGVKDLRGRPAIAIAVRTSRQGEVVDEQLLLDRGTYKPLGKQAVLVKSGTEETRAMKPGTVLTYEYFLALGWTNRTWAG